MNQEAQPSQFNPAPYPSQPEPLPIMTKKSSKKPLIFAVSTALLVLGLGGGGFVMYQSGNSSTKVWDKAMANSAEGLTTLILDSNAREVTPQKINAKFALGGDVIADGSVKVHLDSKSNGTTEMSVGVSGVRFGAKLNIVDSDASDYPDIYAKVDGLSGLFDLVGDSGLTTAEQEKVLSEIDNQWYVIDHTLFDQAVQSAYSDSDNPISQLSAKDIAEITNAAAKVVSGSVFSVESGKAVIVKTEELGKEDFEGTATYKYKAKIDNRAVKTMLKDMKSALADTSIKKIVENTSGQDYDEAFNLDSVLKDLDNADEVEATVWLDKKIKTIRNIRINNKDTVIDIGMPFSTKNRDIVPFDISAKEVIDGEETGNKFKLNVNLNSKTQSSDMKLTLNIVDSQYMTLELTGDITPTTDLPSVEKIDGAKSILDLVAAFTDGSSTGADPAQNPLDINSPGTGILPNDLFNGLQLNTN
jgi:hypothetical protein